LNISQDIPPPLFHISTIRFTIERLASSTAAENTAIVERSKKFFQEDLFKKRINMMEICEAFKAP